MSRLGQRLIVAILLLFAADAYGGEPFRSTVYRAGEKGYDTYRIPAIVRTRGNVLLAFAEARRNNRSDSGDIDLVCLKLP